MKTNGMRSRCRLCSTALAIAWMVIVFNPHLHAQIQASPVWDVNGQIVLIGNNVCYPSPCTETVNFSFDYTYQYVGGTYFGQVVGTPSFTSIGPLGSNFYTITNPIEPEADCGFDTNYMEMLDRAGDEIDISTCGNAQSTPVTPTFPVAQLYRCDTAICITDFAPSYDCLSGSNVCPGIFKQASVQATVVEVPEGGTTIEYCASSFAFIGCALFWKRHKSLLNHSVRAASSRSCFSWNQTVCHT